MSRAGGSIGVRAVGGNQHRLFKASQGRGQGRARASAPGGRLLGALGIQRQVVVVLGGGGGGGGGEVHIQVFGGLGATNCEEKKNLLGLFLQIV